MSLKKISYLLYVLDIFFVPQLFLSFCFLFIIPLLFFYACIKLHFHHSCLLAYSFQRCGIEMIKCRRNCDKNITYLMYFTLLLFCGSFTTAFVYNTSSESFAWQNCQITQFFIFIFLQAKVSI